MKNLELIKLITGIFLVLFGVLFGILILWQYSGNDWPISLAHSRIVSESAPVALWTPIYAGMCIASGVFLISKVNPSL